MTSNGYPSGTRKRTSGLRLLDRAKGRREGEGIAAFWSWWASAKDGIAAAIEDGSVERLAADISRHVDAIHASLAWELSKGQSARHAFCISPEGNPEVRPAAAAWLAASPPADPTWEYHASKQPGPAALLEVGSERIDLSEMRAIAGWDEDRELAGVRLWHPAFVRLPDNVSRQVAFIFLDNLLGEDEVERWIGSIDVSEMPFGGRTPEELIDEIARRAKSATRSHWVLAQRTDRGGNVALVLSNAALKRIDLPYSAYHLCVTLGLGMEQLAGRGDDRRLEDAEDELTASLEQGGSTFVGRSTEAKRRILHFVTTDSEESVALARAWSQAHRGLSARVDVDFDPRWQFRSELLG